MKHTLAQAEARAKEVLMCGASPHMTRLEIVSWSEDCDPLVGYRVAEISWSTEDGTSGVSVFQTDLEGLTCAAVERYVISLVQFDDEDEHEAREIDDACLMLEAVMRGGWQISYPNQDQQAK